MAWWDGLVLLAVTVALVSVILLVLLLAIYYWFVKAKHEDVGQEDEEEFDGGPYDIP
jgi:hypothetical protein